MNTLLVRHYPATVSERLRWLAAGFIFGALAVLVFHQGAFALLHSIGLTPRAPYAMQAAAPFGIPQIWSTTLWGGVWGVLLAAAVHQLDGARLVFAATLFGLILPTLAAWFMGRSSTRLGAWGPAWRSRRCRAGARGTCDLGEQQLVSRAARRPSGGPSPSSPPHSTRMSAFRARAGRARRCGHDDSG